MSKMTVLAGAVAIVALVTALALPIYVEHEHNQAMQRMAGSVERSRILRARPANISCGDAGIAWVTHYSQGFPTIGAVWATNPVNMDSVVKCVDDGFTLLGQPISTNEVLALAAAAR